MDMTSMIDVTFLLLIFFMCTLKFKTLEGRLSAFLPKDRGANFETSQVLEPIEVGIHVRAEGTKLTPRGEPWLARTGGRFLFGPDRRIEYSIGPRRTGNLAGLERELARLGPALAERGAVLRAGPRTVQGEAIAVLDRLLERGVSEVRIRAAP